MVIVALSACSVVDHSSRRIMFDFHRVTESSITNSVQLDGEDVVLVQAILSIKAIVKIDAACNEKVPAYFNNLYICF